MFDKAREKLKIAIGADKSLSDLKPVNTEKRAKILISGNTHINIILF